MIVEIRNPLVLRLFGWTQFPSYVKADHKLWVKWLLRLA
jgi:hypothetical protein